MFARFREKIKPAVLNNLSQAAEAGNGVLSLMNNFFNLGRELKALISSSLVIPK